MIIVFLILVLFSNLRYFNAIVWNNHGKKWFVTTFVKSYSFCVRFDRQCTMILRIRPAEKLICVSELNHLYEFEKDYNFLGLQKQMLFMRCAFESRQEQLTIYPFPGLKVINIRGSNLLALDLITIGSFVSRLSDNNRLLELSMRDYPLGTFIYYVSTCIWKT